MVVVLSYFCEELITSVQILYSLNLSDITSELRVVTMPVVVDLQMIFHT
jgi:hypothetical protein